MWYFIIAATIAWIIYRHKQKQKPEITISVSTHVDNNGWEEEKKLKAHSLKELKKSFQPANNNAEALSKVKSTLAQFLTNHYQTLEEVNRWFSEIPLPDDIKKQETAIRKELNTHYKNRDTTCSKAYAIFLAYKHSELLLTNPEAEWKNFAGLQKLQSNWKSEEYFDGLLTIMHAFKATFPNSTKKEKLAKDIETTFNFWNSRNNAQKVYEESTKSFSSLTNASDKHFCLLGIIKYLERRYKFNPQYKEDLVDWCLKDVEIYKDFLKEFHEHDLFTIDDQIEFSNNSNLKKKKLSSVTFNHVKRLKNYTVPRLSSYHILEAIYDKEQDLENLKWIRDIGKDIAYTDNQPENEQKVASIPKLNISKITRKIEVAKSGQKGKLAFLNSSQEPCSTEDAFQDHEQKNGWNVVRAEVSFWQSMFCLSFWDEIFDGMGQPTPGQDIPHDLFQGDSFYLKRQVDINSKYKSLRQENLCDFIKRQLSKTNGSWTRLLFNGDQDMISYLKSDTVQGFLKRIDSEIFSKIVYRIAQNPNENRSGVPDFIIWNDTELRMSEVKKVREKIRDSQEAWLAWMVSENIPVEIVRVKGIDL